MELLTTIVTALGVLATPFLLLAPLSDLACLLGSLKNARREQTVRSRTVAGRPQVLVLVPVHNEQRLLGSCLESLSRMRRGSADAEVIVLLDACTDRSAAICRAHATSFLEFGQSAPLGKARLLTLVGESDLPDRFDAVVVIDADTIVAPDFLHAIASHPDLQDVAQQGIHGIANPSDSWLTVLAELLVTIRYQGQLPLRQRAGVAVPLTGNGMCFGRNVVRQHGLSCRTIKEDLELYVRLALAGVRIVLAPKARVYAQEAASLSSARLQRERWGAGKWQIVAHYGGRMLTAGLPLRQRLDALAEMTHQGPVVHAAVSLLLGVPLLIGTETRELGVLLLVTPATLAAWTCWGLWHSPRRREGLAALAALPAYAAWRLLVGLVALLRSPTLGWKRSPRG